MSTFDVWILRFHSTATAPSDGLRRVFGIDERSAREIEQTLPRVVKHGVHAKAAGEMRKALESIGAIVECRPAKTDADTAPKPVVEPVRRTSAADRVAPRPDPVVPRTSVEQGSAKPETAEASSPDPSSASTVTGAASEVVPVGEPLLAAAAVKPRSQYVRQAAGAVLAGVAMITLGFIMGNSVFHGEANLVGVGFDGVAIYLLGVGTYDLYTTLRS